MRQFSWSSVFWVNVPLVAAALIGTLRLVPDSRDSRATRLDPVGAILSIVAIAALVYAVIEAPAHGWTSTSGLSSIAVGLVSGLVFAGWELRRHEPMLDLRLFRDRNFSGASLALTLLFLAMSGAMFLQAQYLQFVLDYTPLVAGFALVPAAAGMLWGTGVGTHLSSHLGLRRTVALGIVLSAAGLGIQAVLSDGSSYAPTGFGLLLFGLGAGVAMPAATDAIMRALPASRAGVGSAVNDTVREVGGALGVAVVGSVAAAQYSSTMNSELALFSDLPDAVRAALADNVGAALGMSKGLGQAGSEIATAARDAFVSSMGGALGIAAATALAAAVVALVSMSRSGASVEDATTSDDPTRASDPAAIRADLVVPQLH